MTWSAKSRPTDAEDDYKSNNAALLSKKHMESVELREKVLYRLHSDEDDSAENLITGHWKLDKHLKEISLVDVHPCRQICQEYPVNNAIQVISVSRQIWERCRLIAMIGANLNIKFDNSRFHSAIEN